MTRVKIKAIANCRRAAGWCTEEKPPYRLVGKFVTIFRAMSRWHGYWVRIMEKGKEEHYVFAHAELYNDDCNCSDCRQIHYLLSQGKGRCGKGYKIRR